MYVMELFQESLQAGRGGGHCIFLYHIRVAQHLLGAEII